MPKRCGEFCERIQSCASRAGHEDLGGLLCELARCETGDRCVSAIHSRNGLYHGPFQFSGATWRTQCGPIFKEKGMASCLGKKGMSDLCCATACTAELIDRGGIGNWPVCSRRIGAR